MQHASANSAISKKIISGKISIRAVRATELVMTERNRRSKVVSFALGFVKSVISPLSEEPVLIQCARGERNESSVLPIRRAALRADSKDTADPDLSSSVARRPSKAVDLCRLVVMSSVMEPSNSFLT